MSARRLAVSLVLLVAMSPVSAALATVRVRATRDPAAPSGKPFKVLFRVTGLSPRARYTVRLVRSPFRRPTSAKCDPSAFSLPQAAGPTGRIDFDPLTYGAYDDRYYYGFCAGTYHSEVKRQSAHFTSTTVRRFTFRYPSLSISYP